MINVREQQDLLLDLARKLKKKIIVYVVGGTAMMFNGLKDATKDIDIVFTSEEDRKEFKRSAIELGYNIIDSVRIYGAKPNQPQMLSRGEERFDLFVKEVIHFIFSKEMMKRAATTYEFDVNLILKIADPHDLILMKCATDRVKDKDDVREIIKKYKIDWDIIINEALNQIKLGKNRAVWDLGTFVDDLIKLKVNMPADVPERLWKLLKNKSMINIIKKLKTNNIQNPRLIAFSNINNMI